MTHFTFELSFNSGKIQLFECDSFTWKSAWNQLNDFIQHLEDNDSIVCIGMC